MMEERGQGGPSGLVPIWHGVDPTARNSCQVLPCEGFAGIYGHYGDFQRYRVNKLSSAFMEP
jgi:hypothetical protein